MMMMIANDHSRVLSFFHVSYRELEHRLSDSASHAVNKDDVLNKMGSVSGHCSVTPISITFFSFFESGGTFFMSVSPLWVSVSSSVQGEQSVTWRKSDVF